MSIKWIKEITRRMFDKAGPSHTAVGVELGVPNSSISYWISDEHPERSIPLHHAMSLDEWAGDTLLKEWALRRGYKIEKIGDKERINAQTTQAIIRLASLLPQIAGISTHEIIERGLDGVYCNNDSHAIRAVVGQVMSLCHEITDSLP